MPQSLHPPAPSQVTIILQWDIGLLKVFSVISWPSQVKRSQNETVPCTATWMNLETITLSEVSQTKTNPIWYHLYVGSNIGHKWTYLWNRNRLTDRENRPVVAKGKGAGRGMEWEVEASRYKLLCTGWMNNKVPLNSIENYSQYPVVNHHGKKYEKGCIWMYNWASLVAQMVKNPSRL